MPPSTSGISAVIDYRNVKVIPTRNRILWLPWIRDRERNDPTADPWQSIALGAEHPALGLGLVPTCHEQQSEEQ
jgi:hypothetical protein